MASWPKWEVYEEFLAKDHVMFANGDFQDFKKKEFDELTAAVQLMNPKRGRGEEDAMDWRRLDNLKNSLQVYMAVEVNPRNAQFMDFTEVYDDFNLEEVEDYLAARGEKEDEKEEEEVPVKKEEPPPAPKPREPAKHKSPTMYLKVAPPKPIAARTPPSQVPSHPTTSQVNLQHQNGVC